MPVFYTGSTENGNKKVNTFLKWSLGGEHERKKGETEREKERRESEMKRRERKR